MEVCLFVVDCALFTVSVPLLYFHIRDWWSDMRKKD